MTVNNAILVVDDEEEFLRSASFALRSAGFPLVETTTDPASVLGRMENNHYAAVLLDLMMPVVSGRDLLPKIVSSHPGIPVIMITAVNEVESAVGCIKDGAYDYLLKPVDKARLVTTVRKAIEFSAIKEESSRLAESLLSGETKNPAVFAPIVTESESMKALFRYLEAVATTPFSILIQGETGTGKELFAKATHLASGRKGPFVAVNTAGLDDHLFSDTLFGHEKGAFTGADRKRDGLITKAAQGTLFLDEIGDLNPKSQVKLLRLLEDGTYFSVGSDAQSQAACRIVAASNVNLEKAVSEGRFRKDLYFRLRGHSIRIPSLCERPEDIPALTRHFLTAVSGELGKSVPTPPPQLFTLLNAYSFPGNVRELKAMVADAVGRHTGGVLSLSSFKQSMERAAILDPSFRMPDDAPAATGPGITFGPNLPSLREADDSLVAEALRRCGGNQSQAARLLGITPSALNKRLNK